MDTINSNSSYLKKIKYLLTILNLCAFYKCRLHNIPHKENRPKKEGACIGVNVDQND